MRPTVHKSLFPILRRLSDGDLHSGEDLAAEFGLSRASVSNVLAQADDLGVKIHAIRGQGYTMPTPVEWLSGEKIKNILGADAGAFDLTVVDSVDSTNSMLLQRAQLDACEGTTITTEHQQAGRGRRGRPWHAAVGGSLTFSVLWRFEGGLQSMHGLSLVIGLAIARALNRHSLRAVKLKWPNDILVDYRKLAGILIEVQGDMDGAAFAVVGVGLNVSLPDAQRNAIDQAVIDLKEMDVVVSRNQLLAECLLEIRTAIAGFKQGGFAALRRDWVQYDAYLGKVVRLRLADDQWVTGRSEGVDDTGALLLRLPSGACQSFHGGEVSLRPGVSA